MIATNTSTDLTRVLRRTIGRRSNGRLERRAAASRIDPRDRPAARANSATRFPIIGVGGIVSADAALATLRAGANLIQIYTGFAYRGPLLLEEILDALAEHVTAWCTP